MAPILCRRIWLLPVIIGVFVVGSEKHGWGQSPGWGRRVSRVVYDSGYDSPPVTRVFEDGYYSDGYGSHSYHQRDGYYTRRSHHGETLYWLSQAPLLRWLGCSSCSEGRECACPRRPFCPRGHCKVRETCRTRRDYSRTFSTGRLKSAGGQSVEVEYYSEFEPCCPNFWLKR